MEKIELSPTEAMSALGWKKSKMYYWIKLGKFETVERMDGQKIVISQEDLERLKRNPVQEDFENYQNVSNSSNNFENSSNQFQKNDTKVNKKVQENSNSEQIEFMKNALETIKQIHQSTIQTYSYNVKLLTDGKNELEEEHLKLKAEFKTVEEKLKKSEMEKCEQIKKFELEKVEQNKKFKKVSLVQKVAIIVLSILFLSSLVLIYINSNSLKQNKTPIETVEQISNQHK